MTNKQKYIKEFIKQFKAQYSIFNTATSELFYERKLSDMLDNLDEVCLSDGIFKSTSDALGIEHTHEALKKFLEHRPSAHSPLPWYSREDRPTKLISSINSTEVADCLIIWNFPEENQANAQFIINACNSHYELIEAIEQLLKCYDSQSIKWAEDALNKAKGVTA